MSATSARRLLRAQWRTPGNEVAWQPCNEQETTLDFASIRIITSDIKRLLSFHAQITGLASAWFTEDFAELAWPSGTIASQAPPSVS
jgi:hypothetical protein